VRILNTASQPGNDRMCKLRAYILSRRAVPAARGEKDVLEGARSICDEAGAALVEMALASVIVLAMLFGIIEMSLALYTYHYISDAAREATRYAIVRGSNSCISSSNALTNCNLLPATAGNLQTYVRTLGYPGINGSKITVTSTWKIATSNINAPYNTQWLTNCTGDVDPLTSKPCNNAGNQVVVKVDYAFPLSIPFWRATTLNMSSTSNMVILN
jgi:Flp pilus assembly protein TadG